MWVCTPGLRLRVAELLENSHRITRTWLVHNRRSILVGSLVDLLNILSHGVLS